MADIHFGNGQPITSLSAALTAASNGDTIISHGPHTDTVPTIVWSKNDVTWKHMGGDYTFDGLNVTLDWLRISGTGNRLILKRDGGRVIATRYQRYVLWITGAGNTIEDPYITSCSALVGTACFSLMLYANSTVLRPLIMNAQDNQAENRIIYISASAGGLQTFMRCAQPGHAETC
jgi:hypothetical protein